MINPSALALVTLAAALSLGCKGTVAGDETGAGGYGGGAGQTAGVGGGPTDAGDDASAVDTSPPGPTCNMTPTPLRTSGSTITLEIQPRLGGKTFVFGESNDVPTGGTVLPLNLRLYMSHVALLRAGGDPVPVDLVTTAGVPEPYGVHFFNADDASSTTLRVLAPAGVYTGLTFMFGLDDTCNAMSRNHLSPPLDDDSQMTWPHDVGYLFLRYEGRVTAGDGPDAGAGGAIPPAIHMGGAPRRLFAPVVTAPGALAVVAGQATSRPLFLDMGAIFTGATTEADPSNLGLLANLPEIRAGEWLRQQAQQLPLFVLGP